VRVKNIIFRGAKTIFRPKFGTPISINAYVCKKLGHTVTDLWFGKAWIRFGLFGGALATLLNFYELLVALEDEFL
jgi:hypothetical protein